MKNVPPFYQKAISLCIAAYVAAPINLQAAEPVLPVVKVTSQSTAEVATLTPGGDTAQLFSSTPGYSVATGGGVSGLPVLNGFADDRLKIRIDGMEITSACGNHMNAPLSYIDPRQVAKASAIAGITPVSLGGDSIGGTLIVESAAPVFAETADTLRKEGSVSVSTRSVNNSVSASISGSIANDRLSLGYTGAYSRGESYKDGAGNKVLGSMYESNNHALTLAAKGDGHNVTLRVGEQRIPFQGFPNQYMDMTGNHGVFANLNYVGDFAWGKLYTKVYWQDTEHTMGFFTAERTGTMPMNTHGRDIGYAIKAELPLQNGGAVRLGNEYHTFRLDDWWPPVAGSMMMGPNTYKNINGGKRDRLAFFTEWDLPINQQWTTQFGIRDEIVKTDTGNVQAYGTGMMNAADANAATSFNTRNHDKRDNNIDLTATARYTPTTSNTYEFGYARKTRSPNLYERYSWGRGTMSMTMTNWAGDGNGYVGNIDLKPEVAHTLKATADWHDDENRRWNVKVSPYYSYVENFIDTDVIGTFNPYTITSATGNLLQFANHDARLYGVNTSWFLPILKNQTLGELRLRGNASLTRGKRTDGGNLYRITPFNALVAIDQSLGAWTNSIETQLVQGKNRVDLNRRELETGGYALVNLKSAYEWSNSATITVGITNLFNRQYADPLGGVYLSGLKNANVGPLQSLPGYGRSIDVGLSLKF